MRKTRIVTHNGKAHRDEYLACAIIMFNEYRQGRQTFVERRIAGSSDLSNRDTWVVDTGGVWDPEMRNFDHHQNDPRLEGQCAFDLVLSDIIGADAYNTYRSCSPWMKMTALHDTLGSTGTAQAVGIDPKVYSSTRSPIERAALSGFGEASVIHVESPLAIAMRETGRLITLEAEEFACSTPERLAVSAPPFEHAGMRVWDLRSAWGEDDTVSMAMINHACSTRSVDVVVGKSNRGGGVSLYRQSWATSKLDLAKLANSVGVKFVHKNGFYAILNPDVTDSDITNLLSVASNSLEFAIVDDALA
jgi:hypothetical protein